MSKPHKFTPTELRAIELYEQFGNVKATQPLYTHSGALDPNGVAMQQAIRDRKAGRLKP